MGLINALSKEDLIKLLLDSVEEISGEGALKTLKRLFENSKEEDPLLALEKALRHAFDQGGHPIMFYIGQKIAKTLPLMFFSEVSNCQVGISLKRVGLSPGEGMICSLCKGYAHQMGRIKGFGELREVSSVGDSCRFLFGGV